MRFDKQFFVIPLSGNDLQRSDEDLFKNSYGMLNISQLDSTVGALSVRLGTRKQKTAKDLLRDNYVKKQEKKIRNRTACCVKRRGEW